MEPVPFYMNEILPDNQGDSKKVTPVQYVPETLNIKQDIEQDIERVTASIEMSCTDLTANYDNWLQIGFAFAQELGEMGRSYFHRISRFYPKYSYTDTDKKYDNCLKNQHQGTTIKTFFYLAKQAGVDICKEKQTAQVEKQTAQDEKQTAQDETDSSNIITEESTFVTPLLPDKIYQHLPKLLTETCALFSEGIEKDIFLLSALTVLSACAPNIEGVYFNRKLSAHMFLFITGPSASGKGTMIWSRYLAQAIHEEMFKQSSLAHAEYLKELENYENLPKTQKVGLAKPEEPPRKMLFIPANSSSSALTQLLSENDFRGIIFETEADTLSNTAKQDWGDSTDIFRKAFHHENTSMARRTNREMIEITNPHLAICLSGTPKQVHNLMPDVENGLFSRFMYYAFEDTRGFLNPFVSYQPIDYQSFFTQKGNEVFCLYEKLSKLAKPINFKLTDAQGLKFTNYFQTLLDKNKMLLSRDLDANTKRLGVITFRIAMVLTALRLMELEIGNPYPLTMVCSNQDFDTAMTIATTLESHAVAVYQQMPKVTMKGRRLSFYEKLPQSFTRKEYLQVAKELGIGDKTADNYIHFFNTKLLNHEFNCFTKLN